MVEKCPWCETGEDYVILAKDGYTALLMTDRRLIAHGDDNAIVEIDYCPKCARDLREVKNNGLF